MNHASEQSFLLVTWKKTNTEKYVSRDVVLDALLAYGWIDGRRYALDKDRTMQLICKRKQQDWTDTYRKRVEKLIVEGKLKEAGLEAMNLAKRNGTWLANQNVDNLEAPTALLDALDMKKGLAWWQSAAPSYQRNVLRWLNLAKTDKTRLKRINEIANACRNGQKIKNLYLEIEAVRKFKARISKLEKNIKPKKKLYKIYWADGTFVGEMYF